MFKFQLASRKKIFEKKKHFEILFMHHHRHPSSIHEKGTEKKKQVGNFQGPRAVFEEMRVNLFLID